MIIVKCDQTPILRGVRRNIFFINLRLFKNRVFTTKIDALGWLSQVLMRNFGALRSVLTNPPQFLKMTLMGGALWLPVICPFLLWESRARGCIIERDANTVNFFNLIRLKI